MANLFGKAKSTITEHIKNIFSEGELDEKVAVRKFRITTQHGAIAGKNQEVDVNGYNLDVIISVGYRVKSLGGSRFRIWATKRLNEYIRIPTCSFFTFNCCSSLWGQFVFLFWTFWGLRNC